MFLTLAGGLVTILGLVLIVSGVGLAVGIPLLIAGLGLIGYGTARGPRGAGPAGG
jgi:hypothetical protein